MAIEDAVAVEPAPELKVLVRTRIDHDRASGRWISWQFTTVGVVALLIAAIAAVTWQREWNPPAPEPVIAAGHRQGLSPYAAVSQAAAPRIDRAAPRVRATRTVQPNQAAILAAYGNQVRQGRIDPTVLAVRASGEPLKFEGISIARIAIEPLPKLDAIAGERQ